MSAERRIGWRVAYFFAAFGVFLLDQASKAWAVRSLRGGQTVTLVSGFLDLTYAENTGIAFGQLQEGGSFGRWALVGLARRVTDDAHLVADHHGRAAQFARTHRRDDRARLHRARTKY